MNVRRVPGSVAVWAALLSIASAAQAQPVPAPAGRPNEAAMYEHLKRAKSLAGGDLYQHYVWRCITDEIYPETANAIQRSPVTFQPLKVFDNLYFLGQRGVSAWALKTSAGIVLFDALNGPDDVKKTILPGMERLGLDPRQIKYVVIMHSHGDHFGGANFIKETYGARIVASKADWDVMEALRNPAPGANPQGPAARWAGLAPARDTEVADGQSMMVGDTALKFYVTPGHTVGTLSVIFKTTDGGAPHTVGFFGGLGTPNTAANKRTFIASLDRFAPIARSAGVDVLIANHEEQEQSTPKMEELRLRHVGDPNPYVIGTDAYVRYLGLQKECTLYRMAREGEL